MVIKIHTEFGPDFFPNDERYGFGLDDNWSSKAFSTKVGLFRVRDEASVFTKIFVWLVNGYSNIRQ